MFRSAVNHVIRISRTHHIANRAYGIAQPSIKYPPRRRHHDFDVKERFEENNYIKSHVQKLSRFTLGDDLSSLSVQHDLRQLQHINEQTDFADGERLLSSIKQNIKGMNQRELAILLKATTRHKSDSFARVRRMIDMELRWLLKKNVRTRLMDLDLWFYLARLFYECPMESSFAHVLVRYMSEQDDIPMSKVQYLQLLHLIVLQRQPTSLLENYESLTIDILDSDPSIGDISIISMAYFKTKTRITNLEILRKIIDRTTELLPKLDPREPGYCSVVKSIRYSRTPECRANVVDLVESLMSEANVSILFTSSYNLIHTVKLLESYRIYKPQLLDRLANYVFANLDSIRIKDIQYAITSLSNFAYQDLKMSETMKRGFENLSRAIVNEKRFDLEKQSYHLMPLLRAFSFFGFYDDDLTEYTNKLLRDPLQLDQMSSALEFNKSALLVYVASRIEGGRIKLGFPDDLFKRMSDMTERLGNMGSVRPDSSIKHLNFILKTNERKDSLFNSNSMRSIATSLCASELLKDPIYNFNFQYILPHQNYADLVISKGCRDPGYFNEETLMPQKVPRGQSHCLLLGTRYTDYIDGYNRLSGFKQLTKRLFEKLGYRVVVVDFDEQDVVGVATKVKLALDRKVDAV